MHTQAQQAIIAAKSINSWGRFAARKYAENRGIARLYFLARQLEAMQKAGGPGKQGGAPQGGGQGELPPEIQAQIEAQMRAQQGQ